MKDIKERFEDAIYNLYRTNDYLAAEITKLGYPELIGNDLPTAGVMWDDKRKRVKFLFNKDFVTTLDDEQFTFVVAHEAMHLLNMHIFLFKEKIEDMISKKKQDSEIMRFKTKLNISADCIVNDSLINLYGLKKMDKLGEIFKEPVKPYYGKPTVKCDTHDMTVMEVFYILPEDKSGEGDGPQNHEWYSFYNKDGTVNKDFVDKMKSFIEKNTENSSLSDKEASKVDNMKELMKNSKDFYASQAGVKACGKFRNINGLGNNSLNWSKILFQFVESKRIVDNWNRPNRKLTSVYPDAILPSYVQEEKEEIFVAIDASGSINEEALSLFVEVLKNSPARFTIRAISFDTECYEYDVRSGNRPQGSGGTDFCIIENYILTNLKRYPKAIFVLTDGAGTYVDPKYPERWCWLLYGGCATSCIGNMKHFKILDMLK